MTFSKKEPSTTVTANITKHLFQYIDFTQIRGHIIAYAFIIFIAFPLQKLVAPYLISTGVARWSKAKGGSTLFQSCLYLSLVILVAWLLYAILYYVNLSMQQRIFINVRHKIVSDLIRRAKYTNREHHLGRLVTHLENIPQILEQVVYKLFNYVIPECISIISMTAFFMFVDWRLGLATLGYLCVTTAYFLTFIGGSQTRAKEDYGHQTRYNQKIHNTVDNLAYIQSSQSEPFELHRLSDESRAFFRTKTRFCNRNSAFIFGSNVLLIAYAVAVIWIVYWRMTSPNASQHDIVLSGTVIIILFAQLVDLDYAKYMLTEIYNFTYKSSVFLNDVSRESRQKRLWLSSLKPTSLQSPRGHTDSQSALVIRNVTYKHPHQIHSTFRRLNVRIPTNELCAIQGPSGCGKTTLAKLIAGIYPLPNDGSIVLHGNDVTDDPLTRQNAIAYVPQHVKLFEGSILDNIQYTCTHLSEALIQKTLTEFDVVRTLQRHAKDTRYLQRPVGVNGSELSGGQKQVVLIMRTYFETTETRRGKNTRKRKTILLLDEPTASLDPHMTDTVMNLLKKMRKTHTVIIITHDMQVAKQCKYHVNM